MAAARTEMAIRRPDAQRMGFFTDTTVCIGCKACEVACKQWNDLPADGSSVSPGKRHSYDYTGSLSASTWRHVRFVETIQPTQERRDAARKALAEGTVGALPTLPGTTELMGVPMAPGPATTEPLGPPPGPGPEDMPRLADVAADFDAGLLDRWVFMSDVCKHCTNAGCLDACPTGALIRTEYETVIVQPNVCNGCGYCVPACPFGVINRDPYDGRAAKCTLCYDRLEDGLEPACAKACPTDSIQFGPWDELVERARGRVGELHDRGLETAYLYGAGDEPGEQIAGELGAFFLLTEPPERFGLPAQADSPIQENAPAATAAGLAAAAVAVAATVASFLVAHRRAR